MVFRKKFNITDLSIKINDEVDIIRPNGIPYLNISFK